MLEEMPRATSLYRKLAKDYTPKAAEMKICKYVEELEARLAYVESAVKEMREDVVVPEPVPTVTRRGRKPKETTAETQTSEMTEMAID